VSPKARLILINQEIDGLILDTTFKVMRRCHTATFIADSHNGETPLAFSFGPRESFQLSDRFQTIFQEEFQINLTQYILESDEGSTLKNGGRRILVICFVYDMYSRVCTIRLAIDSEVSRPLYQRQLAKGISTIFENLHTEVHCGVLTECDRNETVSPMSQESWTSI
jgi:hypothetical protein